MKCSRLSNIDSRTSKTDGCSRSLGSPIWGILAKPKTTGMGLVIDTVTADLLSLPSARVILFDR